MDNIKLDYGGVKFTIYTKNNKWWLDFYFKNKRIRRTTKLKAIKDNLKEIKTLIIPDIVMILTGKKEVSLIKKDWYFKEFTDSYFDNYKHDVREHTYKRNCLHFQNHILPYFKNDLIKDITPMKLEEWQNRLKLRYKIQTIKKFRSILFSIFEKAYINDIITINPLSKVKLLSKSGVFGLKDNDIDPFTNNEMKEILEFSNGYMHNFIKLMFSTGMRPGEIIALTWSDIDFEKRLINVNKTIVTGKVGDVKTLSSIRKIDMLKNAELALMNQRELSTVNNSVFVNKSKKQFFSHDIINVNFKLLLEKNSIKVRSLYNIRHSFASQLISKGIDIVWVSRMLGHKDVSITLKIYTKFIKEDDKVRLNNIMKIDTIMDTNE